VEVVEVREKLAEMLMLVYPAMVEMVKNGYPDLQFIMVEVAGANEGLEYLEPADLEAEVDLILRVHLEQVAEELGDIPAVAV
jgi:hypothetical protein